MQRFVDSVLGIAKESLKAFSQESFNNTIKLINGISALILAILPGKASILEGVQGWELKPTFRAPSLPRWMEEGVSSFNKLIHDYAADSDADSDSEYESGADDNDSTAPSSPSSVSSQLSKSSSFWFDKNDSSTFTYGLMTKISDYLKQLLGKSQGRNSSIQGLSGDSDSGRGLQRRSSSSGSLYRISGYASRGFTSVKDLVIHHTTDRRRGIVEDSQLVVELFIERVFDVLRKILLYSLSPFQTLKLVVRKLLSHGKADKETVTIQTATLGDSDPAPSVKRSKLTQAAMNTDARSCEDVITDLGYPYEAIRVVTPDGYLLLMERIPRRDSRKVLYLQHGILDSSLGWVSNGVVGSQAFAAYDQGYDVFLGNFRGLASREHIDKNISARRYWSYSINEHGTQDIPAMINKIHALKMEELKSLQIISSDISSSDQPYTLCGVAHSLGGAGMLMYVVTRRLEGKPHRLSRLILLSPAGFHEEAPFFCNFVQYSFPAMAPILAPLVPGLYIPTKVFRALFNKVARDLQKYPAVGGLVQTLCSYTVGGDSSNWIQAFGQTHFNMYDMPGVAYRVVVHLAQMRSCNRFQMYDFGSASANKAAYGTPYPLDIGANYDMIDIPVDFVGGRKDKFIPRANIKRHYQLLKEKGGRTSYSEFEYAHLDFTFAHREELLAYVMSRLLLVTPPESSGLVRTARKSKSGLMKSESRRDSKRTKSRQSSRASDQVSSTDKNGVGMPDIAELAASSFEDRENRNGVNGNISTYMNGSDLVEDTAYATSSFDD